MMNVNKEKESAYPWYLSIKRKRNKRKKKGELKILLLKGCAGPKGIKQEYKKKHVYFRLLPIVILVLSLVESMTFSVMQSLCIHVPPAF